MNYEIKRVAIIADSKSEKNAVAAALKMTKSHIVAANKAVATAAKKFNKSHKIGSYFANKDGEICKTDSVASIKNGRVKVSILYVASGGGWCDIETTQLVQPHYIKLLNEWLNEPSDVSCDLNETQFENLRTVCEDMGLSMGARHTNFDADEQYIVLERRKETFEARNIDYIEPESDDWTQYDEYEIQREARLAYTSR